MKFEQFNIILSIELEENLYFCLKDFLDSHPDLNLEEVINASLSLFLDDNQTIINSKISKLLTQEIQDLSAV